MTRRFRSAAYGPFGLREILRARLEPGESVVGFGAAQLAPSPGRVLAQIALALLPGFGHLLAAVHGAAQNGERTRVVVLTSRRILLLRTSKAGPLADGSGIGSELPLSLLRVGYAPPPEALAARDVSRRRVGARRAQRRRPEIARQVGIFSLTDLRNGARIDLALDRSGGGATRLREALVMLGDEPATPAEPMETGAGASVGGGGMLNGSAGGGRGGSGGRLMRGQTRHHPRAVEGRTPPQAKE